MVVVASPPRNEPGAFRCVLRSLDITEGMKVDHWSLWVLLAMIAASTSFNDLMLHIRPYIAPDPESTCPPVWIVGHCNPQLSFRNHAGM